MIIFCYLNYKNKYKDEEIEKKKNKKKKTTQKPVEWKIDKKYNE